MGSRAVFLRLLLRLVYTNSPCVTSVEGEFIPIFGHAIELEITHLSKENNPLGRVFIVFGRWVYMGRMTINRVTMGECARRRTDSPDGVIT